MEAIEEQHRVGLARQIPLAPDRKQLGQDAIATDACAGGLLLLRQGPPDSPVRLGEAVLATALQLSEPVSARPAAAPLLPEEPTLRALFLSTLALSPASRARVRAELLAGAGVQDALDPVRVFPALRSALLALAVANAGEVIWSSELWRLGATFGYVTSILPSYAGRLLDHAEEIGPIDLMTLSIGLDCLTSLLDSFPALIAAFGEVGDDAPGGAEAAATALRASYDGDLLALLIEIAETAVLLVSAGPAVDVPARRAADADFVLNALQRELAAVAVSAVVLATHSWHRRGGPRAPADWLARACNLVENTVPLLGPFPHLEEAADFLTPGFVTAIDKALGVSAFLWRKFDLETLHGLTQTRRLVLNVRCHALTSKDVAHYGPLLDPLAELLGKDSWTAIFLNVTLARLFADSAQLKAFHFLAAATAVTRGSFGLDLQRDFALLAILGAHNLGIKLDRYIETLLRTQDDRTELAVALDSVADEQLETIALALLNASSGMATSAAVRAAIGSALGPGRRERTRRTIADLLELKAAQECMHENQALDPEALLLAWRERRQGWHYVALLSSLMATGHAGPQVLSEAKAALAAHSPEQGTNTAFFFLAQVLTEHLLASGHRLDPAAIPVSFLRDQSARWEPHLPAARNESVFRLLYRVVPTDKPFYEHKMLHWMTIKLLADERGRLAQLRDQGRFFALYRYYFEFLESWGLPIDCEAAVLVRRLLGSAEQRKDDVQSWIKAGAKMPKPLIRRGLSSVIGCDFLILGRSLFNSPCAEDGAMEEYRKWFEEAAHLAVPELLAMSTNLGGLPSSVRDLIRWHSERFLKYTIPEAGA